MSDAERQRLVDKTVRELTKKYLAKLSELDAENIAIRYKDFNDSQMSGLGTRTDVTDTKPVDLRVNIVQRINRAANRLLKYVGEGKVVWKNVPAEVRDLFVPIKQKKGRKKWKTYELKPEAYSVGQGRTRQDTQKIIENAILLKQAADDGKNLVFATQEASKKVEKLQREKHKEKNVAL